LGEKVVVILSGGLDSITLLYKLHSKGFDCYPITFVYGQKHVKELQFAIANCEKLGLKEKHKVIDLHDLQKVLNSALIQSDNIIPNVRYEEQRTQQVLSKTVVPFRNGVFLSVAVGMAGSIGARAVAYGAHANDFATYPDCRPDFVTQMEKAAQMGINDLEFKILSPFVHYTKAMIVRDGEEYGVDFNNTWSCYRGGEVHCGDCPSCAERMRAFDEAGVKDPTTYAL
jgi:7-cyano-7-deazaguanine synthase